MSTSVALNDGGSGAKPKQPAKDKKKGGQAKKEKKEKKEKKPKLTPEQKEAAKAEKEAAKAEKKAGKKADKKAAKKAAAAEASAFGQEPSDIGLGSHVQRPTVPPPPPAPLRPALDAVHDAILHTVELQEAEQHTADVIASIHDDIAAFNIDGSRSITRHLIQHVREHRVNLDVDVEVEPPPPAPAPRARRFADDASVAHKVACELHSQAALLRRPVFLNNGVREWAVAEKGMCGKGRCPGCRKRCKICWYGPFRRSRHLLTLYMTAILLLSCALALVDHVAVPMAVFALWLLPGLWTPAVLIKGLCCAGCRDAHGVVTLEWRVQTVFWFGLWLLPALVFFAPIAACLHAGRMGMSSSPMLRWASLGVSLGSLWLLGWLVYWVEAVAQGVDKTSHDRYRLRHLAAGHRYKADALEADALEAERVRRWPRSLPYGFAYRQRVMVVEGIFACSVTFLPAIPWASVRGLDALLPEGVLPAAVADMLRPDLLFRTLGLLDAGALTELIGVEIPFLHLIIHGLVVALALLAPIVLACLRRRTKEEKELEAKRAEEMDKMMEITTKGKKGKKGKSKRPARTAQPPASVLTHRVLTIGAQTKCIAYLCEMLAFPVLLHLLEPFFCTDSAIFAMTTNTSCASAASEGNADAASSSVQQQQQQQCMDADPSVECWTVMHTGMYVLPSVLVLPAYYIRALRAPVKYIRQQTVLDLSPRYMVTTLQLKVVLAVAALAFGGRAGAQQLSASESVREFPWRAYALIAVVEIYALALLLMTASTKSRPGYSTFFNLTWLKRASLIWAALHGALAAFVLVSASPPSDGGVDDGLGALPMYAFCGCLVLPWLWLYSRVRCWCCDKRPPVMTPSLGMHDRPELVDYPIVAARWSAYKALLEQGRLKVVAAKEAADAEVAAAEAAKVAAAEAAMKRAAELFSGKRVLRECFLLWKLEAKTYDDTVWKGLVQLGTIDFKAFKEHTTLEARKEYMAEHQKESDLNARAEASDQKKKDAKEDAEGSSGAVFFSSQWSESLKGATVEVSGSNRCSAMQQGQYTSVWCEDPLPSTGKHYWEIRFEQPGAKPGDWTLRDPYFVGVVNHSKVDENGAGFSKGAWGIVPYNDDRALRSDGMDGGVALPKACRNEQGNLFGSGDRVGVLADMDARPRTLQFYRNRTLIKGAKVSGVSGNVRIIACPYNRGMSVSIAFSPPVEQLVRFRADLFAAMKPEAPKGRLAQAIADCELAGLPETDEEMIEARQMQSEVDAKLRLVAEREEQRKLTVASLGDAGTGAALREIVDPDADDSEPAPPGWYEEVSDDEDDEVPTPWEDEVFELRLNEVEADYSSVSAGGSIDSYGRTGSTMPLHGIGYENDDGGGNDGLEARGMGEGARQIEPLTLEMVLCKAVHIMQRDDSGGALGSKEGKLGRQRCKCTSRSVRKGCKFCKCFTCGCSCCCGDCCYCCQRVDLHPVPKVRVVGVDIATAGGQRFITLLDRIKLDQQRETCSRCLRLGLCRCLSCGCVGRTKALGVDIIEVRFVVPGLSRKQFWCETGWGPEMKRAVASVKALEGKGKHKCNGGKGIKITRAPLDTVMHLEEALLKVRPSADHAVRAMMRALPGSGVTELRLRRNGLTDSALRSIARGLRTTVLSELYLAHNHIGDHGCMSLASALPGSRVWKVDLTANRIGDDGALALAAVAWRGTSRVQEIMLYDNSKITAIGLSALESACDHRRQLRHYNLATNADASSSGGGGGGDKKQQAEAAAGEGEGEEDRSLVTLLATEPLAVTDGETTVALGEQPGPVLFKDLADDINSIAGQQHAPLYVAVAYASTPRHIDGRPVAGSRTLQGRQVSQGTGGNPSVPGSWDPKYTSSGLQLR